MDGLMDASINAGKDRLATKRAQGTELDAQDDFVRFGAVLGCAQAPWTGSLVSFSVCVCARICVCARESASHVREGGREESARERERKRWR